MALAMAHQAVAFACFAIAMVSKATAVAAPEIQTMEPLRLEIECCHRKFMDCNGISRKAQCVYGPGNTQMPNDHT